MKNEEKKIVENVIEDFRARQLLRKPFETTWQLSINFLMGNQYCNLGYGGVVEESEKQYFWQEREVFNHIAPIYDIRCAKLINSRPSLSVLPATNDERDKQSAKVSKKILDSISYKLGLDNIVNQGIKWSEVCGTVFYKVTWNNSKGQLIATDDEGKQVRGGEVEINVCNPFEIYPDLSTRENLQECQSIIHARALPVDQIKTMYGIEVKPENINCYSLSNVNSGIGGLGYYGTATKLIEQTKTDSALVIERYTRPNSELPNGRLTIVVGDKLVYDDDLPYMNGSDGKREFPFIRQVCLENPGCFWGSSMIERLVPVQRAYNAIKNRKHEFINRLTLGVLSVEDGSVDLDDLEEEGLCPGKVLVYRQGATAPEYLSGENIPSGFADEEEKLLDEFTKISGISDKYGFDYATNNLSGTALELMIGQDEIRLNTSSESIKDSYKEIAKNVLMLYKQYALFPRLARIVGEKGEVELFYFSSSDISSDDVTITAQAELGDSLPVRRDMVFKLLDAGILNDENGKLSTKMKSKILEMLGLGVWESAQDLSDLHIKKAGGENLKMKDGIKVAVSEIDDHALHIDEHIAFMLSADYEKAKKKNDKIEAVFLEHIRSHKEMKGE